MKLTRRRRCDIRTPFGVDLGSGEGRRTGTGERWSGGNLGWRYPMDVDLGRGGRRDSKEREIMQFLLLLIL